MDKCLTIELAPITVGNVSPPYQLVYPIRAVANMTGLSIDTLRAWERRYQAVQPLRGQRGRMYGPDEIRRLTLLRDLVIKGHAIGQVAGLKDEELERLLRVLPGVGEMRRGTESGLESGLESGSGDFIPSTPAAIVSDPLPMLTDPIAAFMPAIEAFDSATLDRLLSRSAALLPVREFILGLVFPLARRVGDGWHNGTLSIAQEHMASGILRNLLGGMIRLQPGWKGQARLAFATPAGELHEFGILGAAILSIARGFEVVYLGPNLPAEEIVRVAKQTSPWAVVLGMKATQATPVLINELTRLEMGLPRGTELWLGGSGTKRIAFHMRPGRACALEDFAAFEEELNRLAESVVPGPREYGDQD